MIDVKFFLGAPLNFKNKFKVYPPTINDIVTNEHFGQYLKLLTYSQEDLEDEFADKIPKGEKFPTPFEFLLANCYHSKQVEDMTKKAFKFFIHEDISFLYDKKKIIIGDIQKLIQVIKSVDELVFLEEEEFFDFQNMIRASMAEKPQEIPDPNESPIKKRMKAKARLRDRVKAKSKKATSLETMLTSICCMGIGITPLNIGEMSYVQVNQLIARYQDKEKYDIDVRSLLAGADSKKVKPKYWIRNLDE